MTKIKIVLDTDVIIHFAKGGYLGILPTIFPNYDFIVLNNVYKEIKGNIKTQLDNQVCLLKNISIEDFSPKGEMLYEYARIKSLPNMGDGESSCMAYCRYTHNVIGSSNLRDIKDYCQKNKITFLTTIDFLFYAIKYGKMKKEEATQFIIDVQKNESILPDTDFDSYRPNAQLF